MHHSQALIIGGGLSGLVTAYLLKKEGVKAVILEARSRPGGRIHTLHIENEPSIEMGASWLGKNHSYLLDLLKELEIRVMEQLMGNKAYYEPMSVSPPQLVDLPPNDEPSYRIEGGTDTLIRSLETRLDENLIHYGQVVNSIRKKGEIVEVQTNKGHFSTDVVISTLPPRLLVDGIEFSPLLPEQIRQIASETHTWMGESIKVALTFEKPFWQKSDSSGTIFSNVGPVQEMYDHSGRSGYALKGFMNGAYHSVTRDERKELVLRQLRRFYGSKTDGYTSYHECVWIKENFTYSPYEQHVLPHQNNGHPVFQNVFMDGKLLISGAETATVSPGYMDGAVESAVRVVRQVKEILF